MNDIKEFRAALKNTIVLKDVPEKVVPKLIDNFNFNQSIILLVILVVVGAWTIFNYCNCGCWVNLMYLMIIF